MAHRSCRRRTTARKHRVGQRAKAANRVTPRTSCLTHYVDINRTQLAHRDIQIEVLINAADVRLEESLELIVAKPGNIQVAYLRDVDCAVAIYTAVHIQI